MFADLPVKSVTDPAAEHHVTAGACGLSIWPIYARLDQCRITSAVP